MSKQAIAEHELCHIIGWSVAVADKYPKYYADTQVMIDVQPDQGEAACYIPALKDNLQREMARYAALTPLILHPVFEGIPHHPHQLLAAGLSERDLALATPILGTPQAERYLAAAKRVRENIQFTYLARDILCDKRLDLVDLKLPDLVKIHWPSQALKGVDARFRATKASGRRPTYYA